MTDQEPTWAAAVQRISVDGQSMPAEDLVDACLLLALAERVHVFSPEPGRQGAKLLARHLRGLGYPVSLDCEDDLRQVKASDTVVTFLGPDTADLTPVRTVAAAGAVLIAITTPGTEEVSELADAVIDLPRPTQADWPLPGMVFDLLALVLVEAIGHDLTRRLGDRAISELPQELGSGSRKDPEGCTRPGTRPRRHRVPVATTDSPHDRWHSASD